MSGAIRQTARANIGSATGRIADLEARAENTEKQFGQVLVTIGQKFDELSKAISKQTEETGILTEILNACVGLVGEDAVRDAVQATRLQKMQNQMEQNNAQIAENVANGKLKVSDAITADSIIVGKEYAQDATEPNAPGLIHINFSNLAEDFKTQLLGQGPGFKVATPPGGSFEVVAVYDQVPQTTEQALEAELAKDLAGNAE